jgi:hypothetical protein
LFVLHINRERQSERIATEFVGRLLLLLLLLLRLEAERSSPGDFDGDTRERRRLLVGGGVRPLHQAMRASEQTNRRPNR